MGAAVIESRGNFDHALVTIKFDDIAGAVHDRRAVLASAEMLFDSGAQLRLDVSIEIGRHFAPDFFATDYHGLFPFANDNRELQLPPSPGDNRSRNIRRARSKRVFTAAAEMLRVFAV